MAAKEQRLSVTTKVADNPSADLALLQSTVVREELSLTFTNADKPVNLTKQLSAARARTFGKMSDDFYTTKRR